MNNIDKKLNHNPLKRGGITMYSKKNAIDFVIECSKNNIRILGIDGFFLTTEKTQPSLENSIDFSLEVNIQNVYKKAIAFLENKNEELYFEIVNVTV